MVRKIRYCATVGDLREAIALASGEENRRISSIGADSGGYDTKDQAIVVVVDMPDGSLYVGGLRDDTENGAPEEAIGMEEIG